MSELSQLSPGTMLGDRYRIEELISIGGMGAVYAASHMFLNRRLAIKVLRNDLPGAEMMADRFRREAIAASAIGHENIVRVTDMGMSSENTPYLVMELLEGSDLADALDQAPFSVSRSTRITCAVLRGLGAAHRAGIVHRDLKPENIFLANEHGREVVKILDFGVSLLERPEVPNTRLTSTGVVVGTPRYMSPEQARGDVGLTGAVDIYAAAVVLYEMLTKEHPYHGANYNVIIHQIIAGDWIPIETRRGGLPPALVEAIGRAMALEPSDRFSSADEMADALEPFTDYVESANVVKTPSRPPARPTAETVQHGGVARLSEGSADDPAWASAPPALDSGGRGRQFTVDPEFESRSKDKGRHNLVIAMIGAIAVVAAVFVVLQREGSDSAAAGTPDAGAGEVAAVDPPADPQPALEPQTLPPADASVAETEPPEPEPPKPEPKKPEPKKPEPKKPEPRKAKPEPKPDTSGAARRRDSVTITLLVIPPSAKVVASGGSVSGKRVTARRGKSVRVRLEAPGYVTQSFTVKADRDRDVVRTLSREPEKPPEPEPEPEPETPEPKPAEVKAPEPTVVPAPTPAPSE